MADNIIDSLKVVLELDPAKYIAGQKEASKSFKDTGEQAKKTAEELEESGAQGSEFFDRMSSAALKLGSITVAGLGLNDLKNFVKEEAAAGNTAFYMSKNIGITAERLDYWGKMIKLVGGNSDEAQSSLLGISSALASIQIHGKGSEAFLGAFRALNIDVTAENAADKLKDVDKITQEVQVGLQRLAKINPRLAHEQGRELGYSEKFLDVLLLTGDQFEKNNKLVIASGLKTSEWANESSKLTTAWANFANFFDTVGSRIATTFDKMLTPVINTITKILEISDKLSALSNYNQLHRGESLKGLVEKGEGEAKSLFSGGSNLAGSFKDWIAGKSKNISNEATSEYKSLFGSKPAIVIPVQPQTTPPVAGESFADKVFNIIQKIEGGKVDSKTETKKGSGIYAYGKNQITLDAALSVDATARNEKLLDPAYNDEIARKLQAKYAKKYGNDVELIDIAYHNGEGSADNWVKFKGDTSKIANWGDRSDTNLRREREITAAYRPSNSSSTVVNVQNLNVNAPNAKNVSSIIDSAKQKYSNNVNQANPGPG